MSPGFLGRLFGRGKSAPVQPAPPAPAPPAAPASGLLDERQVALRCAEAREEERRRVAVDLHDGPIQQLVNLVLRLDMAEKGLGQDIEQSRAEIRALRQFARDVLQDMRRFMFELRPASLDEFALIPVLRTYLQDFRSQHGIAIEMKLTDTDWRLDRNIQINVFRIAQEALTNVRKHAKATQVEVSLARNGTTVVVEVSDNGGGFDVESALARARREKRLGLASMKDRAHALGGDLLIDSTAQGTRVRITVPVGDESAA